MKISNGLLIALVCSTPMLTVASKKKKTTQLLPAAKSAGPIGNPYQNPLRAVVITCPVCPNFVCTGISGITGITGCTGIGCTGCFTGNISSFCCLGISQSATVRGPVTATTANVLGNVGVSGSADFKSDLIVQGNGSLYHACVGGQLNVDNDASVSGFEVILGSLTTTDTIINGNLNQNGNQILNGSLSVTGNSTIGQNLIAQGTATIAGLLTANKGSTGLSGPSLNVFNGSIVNNGLTILNIGCTAPTGPIFCTGALISGNVSIIGDEMVSSDFAVTRELTVDRDATFNGQFISTGTLIANNIITMNDGFTIASGDQIINAGNLNLIDPAGIFQVGDLAILKGSVTTNAGAIISNGLTVTDGQTVPMGNFDIPQGSVSMLGAATVGGSITSNAGQSQFTNLTITSTDNALCATGPGAVVVADGVGIAKDIWEGNCQYFNTVEFDGGIPGCLDYYEESCFSTSFIWGGQPVTPATNILVQLIRVGNIVNIIIPEIIINNPGSHIDVISSSSPLPTRFRPTVTVRGAASTVIYNIPANTPAVVGQLGEFNISPSGIITIGLTGDATSPQRILSTDYVYADINTITYNVSGCAQTCKRCSG